MDDRPLHLFLDFDGVLHAVDASLDAACAHADRLGSLLADFPMVRVIVSSSWREIHTLDEMREFCGTPLGPRLVDATPVVRAVDRDGNERVVRWYRRDADDDRSGDWMRTAGPSERADREALQFMERFEEIAAWLARYAPTGLEGADYVLAAAARDDWIALDDCPHFFPNHCRQLLLIDQQGFRDEDAAHLRERLEAMRASGRST